MSQAVKLYENAAIKDGVHSSIARAINLAGRQRMLTQKMTKEFLLISLGYQVEANQYNLNETVAMFDKTLHGLQHGNSSLGLTAAPNHAIRLQLEQVENIWKTFSALITSSASNLTKKVIFQQNLQLLKEMNLAVEMFEAL